MIGAEPGLELAGRSLAGAQLEAVLAGAGQDKRLEHLARIVLDAGPIVLHAQENLVAPKPVHGRTLWSLVGPGR